MMIGPDSIDGDGRTLRSSIDVASQCCIFASVRQVADNTLYRYVRISKKDLREELQYGFLKNSEPLYELGPGNILYVG